MGKVLLAAALFVVAVVLTLWWVNREEKAEDLFYFQDGYEQRMEFEQNVCPPPLIWKRGKEWIIRIGETIREEDRRKMRRLLEELQKREERKEKEKPYPRRHQPRPRQRQVV